MNKFILFGIMLLTYLLLSRRKKMDKSKQLRIFIIVVSIPFILDSALRNLGVGSDTFQYSYLFESVRDRSFKFFFNRVRLGDKDYFFYILMKAFQLISPRFHMFLGFVAFTYFATLGVYLYKHKLNLLNTFLAYTFYLMFFYNFFSMTGIRQTLAVAFVMMAYLLVEKRIISAGLIILGALMHLSAILALVVFFFKRIKNLGVVLVFVPFILPFAFQFRNQLSAWFTNDNVLSERFSVYSQEAGAGSLWVTIVYVLVLIGMYVYFNEIASTKEYAFNMKLYVICIMCLPLMWMSNTAFRVSLNFSMAMFILVPVIVENIRFQGRYFVTFLILLALTYIVTTKQEPYHFYWQEMIKYDRAGYPTLFVEPLY